MDYRQIKQIACYEIKTLTRDWSFRLTVLVMTLLIAFLHLVTQSNLKGVSWIAISLPSAIPFANAYLVNYVQVIIIVFWAAKFLLKTHPCDTLDSVMIRPFTNRNLLYGKMLGFILVLFGWDVIWGVEALMIHLFFSDSPFALYPYLFYLLTLTLPTLVFVTGIVCCLKGLIRHSVLSFLILFVFLFFEGAWSSEVLYGVTDVFASKLPNVFSDVTGFSGLTLYLQHRLAFLLWGLGLLGLSVFFVNRIPNNRFRVRSSAIAVGGIMILSGSFFAVRYLNYFESRQEAHELARAVFLRMKKRPKVL